MGCGNSKEAAGQPISHPSEWTIEDTTDWILSLNMPKEFQQRYQSAFMDNMITGKVLLRYFEEGTLRTRVKKMGVESSFHADFFVEEFSAVARLPKQNHQAPNRAQVSPPPQSEKHSTKPPAGPSGPKAAPTPTSADEAIHTPAEEHDALGVPPLSEEEVAKATEEGAVEIATAKIDEVLGAVGSIADLDDGILGGIGAQVVGGALDFVGKALANTPVGFLVGPVWAAAGAIFEASLQVVENRANCARLTVLILDLSNCLTKTDPDTLKGMKREIEGVKSKMDECVELVKKFVGQKWWKRMLSAGSDADAFAEAHRDLDEAWDRTVRTKIMMQPMRPTGGSDKYDNDEKLKTRLLEQTGCSDVKAALAVVAKDEGKMRAVMESMSMDTRVLETVITTSVAGLRGDLEEMGIKITEKIEVIARSLSSKISEKNKELIEGIKGHIDMMKAADLPDDLPDDMKMWWVDNFGSKASVSVGVFRRALASAGGDAGRVISKAGAQMEEALTNAGITTSESPTELFVDLVVMPIINCVHDGNVEGAELLLFWNEARNAAKKQGLGVPKTMDRCLEVVMNSLGLDAIMLVHRKELNEIRSIIKPAMPRSAIRSGLRALLKGTRDWLVEEVDTWIKAAKEKAKDKVFLFTAGPGMGKTVFSAKLANEKSEKIVAAHFTRHDSERMSSPKHMVASLAYQCAERFPGVAHALLEELKMIMEDFGHWDALPVKDLFERTLSVPLVTGMTQKDSLVMLLDALDEAAKSADRNRLLQLLTGPFKRLPPNVRMVITSRPYPEVVDRIKASYNTYELDPNRPENVVDLEAFVRHHLKREVPESALDAATAAVMRNANGSYTYAIAVLDDPDWMSTLEEGADVDDIVVELPDTLDDAYDRIMASWARNSMPEDVQAAKSKIFPAMMAALEPLLTSEVAAIADISVSDALSILGGLNTIVKLEGPKGHQFAKVFHKSVSDWLTDKDAAGEWYADQMVGHEVIFEWCVTEASVAKSTVPEYIASNALSHAEKLIRSDGAKISPEMRAKVETIATSVPVLCRVFESKLAREHASKLGKLVSIAAKLASEGCSEAAALKNTLQLVVRSLGLVGQPVDAHPDLLVAALTSLPEESPLRSGALAMAKNGDHTPNIPAEPRSKSFGRAIFKMQGHTGRMLGCNTINEGKNLVSWGSEGLVIVWDLASGMATSIMRAHAGPVVGAVEVPSDGGLQIITWGEDRWIKIWDVGMGEVLAEIERPKHPPKECHVEPDTGDIFMWSNRDATPNVWRWKTVPDVLMMLKAHESHKVIIGCVMADGGRRAITWESDRGIIVLWRIKGAPAAERIYGNRDSVNFVSIVTNGEQYFAMAYGASGELGCLSMWPLYSTHKITSPAADRWKKLNGIGMGLRHEEPLVTLVGTSGKVDQCQFFRHGGSLAVVGVANAHCLRWDVPMLDTEGFMSDQDPGLTLQPVWKTECGAPEHDFLCISEDRSRALVHGWGSSNIVLLDIASGEILYKIQDGYSLKWLYNRFPKTNHITWPLGFLPGSKDTCIIQVPPKTASGEPEAWLEIRRLDESEEVLHRWSHKGHSKEVQIHVERDEERKMTRLFSSLDNIVKVVDVPDNGTVSEIALDGHAAPVARVEGLSGDRVVSYAEDAIILWDSAPATAGEDEEEDNLQAMGGRVAGMCAIPLTSEGSLVAVWGGSFGNPGIEIWDPNTKAKLGWASGHTAAISGCVPLKNSVGQQLLVSYGWDGMICFWQVPAPGSTPGELSCVKTEQLPDVAVSGLVTNADGTRAVAWGGRRVMLMETPGSKTVTVDLPSSVADCMVVSDEGNGVLVWDRGGMLASYDWEGTKNNDYTGHDRAILAIAVTDDRAHIASIGRDKRVLLFDATSGKPVWETDSMEVQCEKEQLGVIFAGESVVTWDSSGRIYLREVAGKGRAKEIQAHKAAVKGCIPLTGGRFLSHSYGGSIISWSPSGVRQFHVGVHASELSNVLCLPDQDAAISFDSREGKAASWCLDSGRLIQSHVLGATQVLERRRGGCPMLACFTSGQRSVLRISDAGALTAKEDEVTEEAAESVGDGEDFDEKKPAPPTVGCVALPMREIRHIVVTKEGAPGSVPSLVLLDSKGLLAFT